MARHSPFARWRRRHFDYPVVGALVWLLFQVFRALPPDAASAVGGWIGRTLGPRLAASRKAARNLEQALPALTPAARRAVIRGMWDNLGRVMAEYPHLERLMRDRVEVVGGERLAELARRRQPALLFSAHLANWELLTLCAVRYGMRMTSVYRPPNNPYVRRLIERARNPRSGTLVAKGREGARALVATLRRGGMAGLLVDQKLNDGIPVPFFGREAMTAPAIAQFAYRFDCPVIPVRIERLEGTRFRVTVLPPLERPDTGDREADVRALLLRINGVLEDWIRARPEQWLWLHRRWPT